MIADKFASDMEDSKNETFDKNFQQIVPKRESKVKHYVNSRYNRQQEYDDTHQLQEQNEYQQAIVINNSQN